MKAVRKSSLSRSLKPGTMIHGRYQIRQELGAGGFGITYQVWDHKENCILAMKEFMPQDVANRWTNSLEIKPKPGEEKNYERFQKKFLDEAKLIYQYRNHPNIVEVKHLFRENNTAYYTMEYLEGMDFGNLIKIWGPQIPWERITPLMSQTVEALSAIHRSGMVHCDISPDNLCVMKDGTVKLIDFGAAKNFIKGPSSVIFLKKGYAPPEQYVTDGKLGPWTDIYALAVMIYYAYTGVMPQNSVDRLVTDQLLMPSQMGMRSPGEHWEAVMKKALALRPEERYSNVREFWEQLNNTDSRKERRRVLVLDCISGYHQGRKIMPEKEILFGTDLSRCQIHFPLQGGGISPVHMRVWMHEGQMAVMDLESRNGTFLNRKAMTPGLVYIVSPGDVIQLGRGELFQVAAAEIR